jgi:hypothetical protein
MNELYENVSKCRQDSGNSNVNKNFMTKVKEQILEMSVCIQFENLPSHLISKSFSFTYTCEQWFLVFVLIFQIFGKKIRKIFGTTRGEVTEKFRRLHNEELWDLYTSASAIGA